MRFAVLAAMVVLPVGALHAQSAEDSAAVQISVAAALRPSLKARVLFESRERPTKAQAVRRESAAAARVATQLGARLAHKEDAMQCKGIRCTLAPDVDQFVLMNVVQFSGDTAQVEVSEWFGPGAAASRTVGFIVTRTATGWVAHQGEWYVLY